MSTFWTFFRSDVRLVV